MGIGEQGGGKPRGEGGLMLQPHAPLSVILSEGGAVAERFRVE